MATYILGISCSYHDSSAAIIRDGEIIAAAQEERFTRKKHDSNFPINAIEYCLAECGIKVNQINYIAFYDKPFHKLETIIKTYLSYAPLGFLGKMLFPEQHESHAGSAFYPSPFENAAILTVDGVGGKIAASFGSGKGNDFNLGYKVKSPNSLGLLYSAFTHYAGFKINSAEFKVMGLAPYGEANYVDLILKELIGLKEDGSFKLNRRYFNCSIGHSLTNDRFHKLFGGKPRKPETAITKKEMDIARSIQTVTDEIMIRMVRHVYKITGQKNLCLGGGIALNSVSNGKILKEGLFERIWIQPAAGDAGCAIGAALTVWYKYLGNKRSADGIKDMQKGSFLGPSYTDKYIEDYFKKNNICYEKFSEKELLSRTVEYISNEKVIGWFQGRMEFGPRSLGARSIIGDARSSNMQSRMNLKIKQRESFRPFAPAVLAENASEYFDIQCESPYMLLVANVNAKYLNTISRKEPEGFERMKIVRSKIPAVTHIDNSARIQTVSKDSENHIYYKLLKAFNEKTDCPVIINTSFNVRGEPIVLSPEDAYRCFMATDIDYLVIGSFIVDKQKQQKEKHSTKQSFELD